MTNQFRTSDILHDATVSLSGTLVQLDYLLELVARVNMTAKQREDIERQVHRLKVNNTSIRNSLRVVPKCGNAMGGDCHE